MANVNPPASIHSAARSSDMASEVAADMSAIFGDDRRVVDEASRHSDRDAGARQGKRPRSRSMMVALLGAIGFAAMIGAGVVVGKGAVGAANVGSSARLATGTAPPAPTPASRSKDRTLTPVALPPAAPPDGMVASIKPLDVPVRATAVAKRRTQAEVASAPPRPDLRSSNRHGERADMLFRRSPRLIHNQPANAPAAMAMGARADCFGDTDCTNVRLYAADGDVARAYAQATASGVRVRDLRDYRSEWIRARTVAADRPREALRIYDMVAADLRALTDDAVADDRTPWQ